MTDIATPVTGIGGADALPDPVRVAVERVRGGLDDLQALLRVGPDGTAWQLSDEQISALFGVALEVRGRVEAVTAGVLDEVEQRDLPRRVTGAASTSAWLRSTHGLSRPDASRLVRETRVFGTGAPRPGACLTGAADSDRGERVERVAPTIGAWLDGDVTAEQAVVIARTIQDIDPAVPTPDVHRLQADLIDATAALTYDELCRVCRHAVEVVDPDGADQRLADLLDADEARALAETTLSFRPCGPGVVAFSGKLPQVQADMWRTHLEAFTSPRHLNAQRGDEQTTPVAAEADGLDTQLDLVQDEIETQRECLSYGQRLGRAHCELLEHLPTDGLPQHGAVNATIVVTVDHQSLVDRVGAATLDTGTDLSIGQTRRLACNAMLLPAVLDGPSRILDLGTSQRLFDRFQRIALGVRDQGCAFPGCDRVPAWCEAHHLQPWSAGGPTNLDNGCLLCPFHHHLIHTGGPDNGWWMQMSASGIPEVLPPHHLDPQRRPRRHRRFDARPRAGP